MDGLGGRNPMVELWHKEGGKPIVIAVFAIFFLFIAYIVGTVAYIGAEGFSAFKDYNVLKCFYYAFATKGGLIGTAVVSLLAGVITVIMFFSSDDLNRVAFEDERGVKYDKKGDYGTAHPMTRKEAKEVFEIGDIQDVSGPILGQFTSGGKQTICLPPWTDRNRNIVILGSPGTGKSFGYVRNAVFQAAVRQESIVVTDPKGEIYSDMAGFLREQGYEVRVFDLVDLQASDAWDCMQEIYNPITGDLDQLRLNEFSDTIFRNTADGKDDPFWGTGEKNLFNAAIAFSAYLHEKDIKDVYLKAAQKYFAADKTDQMAPEHRKALEDQLKLDSFNTMNDRRKVIRFIIEFYEGKDNVDKVMQSIETGKFFSNKQNPPRQCDIASIYHLIVSNDLDQLKEKFDAEKIPISHVAAIAWSIFLNGSDNVKPGFVTGLAQRLFLFQMRDLRRITSKQDVDQIIMERLGERKCAYFCVLSDKNAAMRPIASLFFSFMFRDVADAADRYGPTNRVPVNVILDEFSNIGMIPNFAGTISTVRSRKINISIILQSVSQLAQVYGDKSLANTIIACCDTVLFLGCNDAETAEYMSDLSGVASIRVGSTKDSRPNPFGFRPVGQGYDLTDGAGKRNVYNPDEIRAIGREEVLIYHNGCNMLRAKRCGFIEHPFYKAGMPPQEFLSMREPASSRFALNEALDSFTAADLNKAIEAEAAKQDAVNKSKDFGKKTSGGSALPFNTGGKKIGGHTLTD